MVVKRTAMVCMLLLPFITGMRDPFEPVADRCLFSQLTLWRLQGVLLVDGVPVGLVQPPSGRWQRIREGDSPFAGWRIVRINKEEVSLENGDGCSPANWQWKREGTQHDKTDSGDTLLLHRDDESERERKRDGKRKGKNAAAGHADGGRRSGRSSPANAGGTGKT